METTTPAITRLVEHLKGPAKVSQLLGGKPVYQEIQRWVSRGWASPMHILALEPHLPPGMTIRDLYADRTRQRAEDGGGQSAESNGSDRAASQQQGA